MNLHSHRVPPDLIAFFEFFGSAIVFAIVIFQALRLALPAAIVIEFGAIIGTFSFLVAVGISAWMFEFIDRHRH
jgi:hypothetical protein